MGFQARLALQIRGLGVYAVRWAPNSPTFYGQSRPFPWRTSAPSPRAFPEEGKQVWMRCVVGDPVKRIMEINLCDRIDWILNSTGKGIAAHGNFR
jgi:hypothetical protein